MLNLNRAMIIGNATRDPEMRTTATGRSVTGFAVATNRRWTDQQSGEQKEDVQFHEIVAWGKLAEIAKQVVQKGTKVYVEGRLQTRTWEGQDGARREKTEIIAENIIALSGRSPARQDVSEEAPAKEIKSESKTQAKNENSAKGRWSSGPKEDKKETDKESVDEEINLDDIPF